MTRIAIIGDEVLFRACLRAVLEKDRTMEVVVEGGGDQPLARIAAARPEVVVLSAGRSAETEAVALIPRLRDLTPTPQVLFLPSAPTPVGLGERVRVAGAAACLGGEGGPRELRAAVRALTLDGRAPAAGVSASGPGPEAPLTADSSPVDAGREQQTVRLASLTPREREVLVLLADGMSNREIARRLVISAETVKDHVGGVLTKLGTDNRVRAAAIAWQAGLTSMTAEQVVYDSQAP
ncbi:response regulator transcription factor [Streptomyces coacervatus]|uniref:Response regulator transcription factor n=1 Tax=Streptomyces coacervatus TaxID=647381 RepID=A0ABP7HNX4_9ACTN|nr:response regulator transcription factor [Streptomyces coacervatus]MDF2270724.1 response regulator transcription factor [Streptomyces coacervatus]